MIRGREDFQFVALSFTPPVSHQTAQPSRIGVWRGGQTERSVLLLQQCTILPVISLVIRESLLGKTRAACSWPRITPSLTVISHDCSRVVASAPKHRSRIPSFCFVYLAMRQNDEWTEKHNDSRSKYYNPQQPHGNWYVFSLRAVPNVRTKNKYFWSFMTKEIDP